MVNTPPNRPTSGIGQHLEEALARIEAELRQAVACVNDTVVPQVRRESIQGLRMAAGNLRKLADRFERETNAAASQQTEDSPLKPSGEAHP